MKKVLAICLSLCLLLCFPIAATAEDEDLFSHYNGDDQAYYNFLCDYFGKIFWENNYYEYYDSFDWVMGRCSPEMAKMFNATRSDFEHPYLRGTIDEETGEITITGLRATGYEYGHYTVVAVSDIVIPDEIDGHPVTAIREKAFVGSTSTAYEEWGGLSACVQSVTIGDNVRIIGKEAFKELSNLKTLHLGESVQIIENEAFWGNDLHEITSWGSSLQYIGNHAFLAANHIGKEPPLLPLPDTVEYIGSLAFYAFVLPETYVVPKSVQKMYADAFSESCANNLVILNKDVELLGSTNFFWIYNSHNPCLYCYAGSTAEEHAKKYDDPYRLIDEDSLLYDGEAVEGNVLRLDGSMTEAQLRAHLNIDGNSSEIQIDGLRDGKVVNGTTVTLFHTVAQAPGKVYTVEKEPEIVSVAVETLPTKTSYFYKEAFIPDGLSLRVTYDDGTETVVTDGITLTGTDLKLGTNTITATYENVSTTFNCTVRYAWWQHLIRIFLFGFLWY